jgi:formate-dependent nitrite reductase membrane component NrfD
LARKTKDLPVLLGELTIWYLFFGGVGSGVYLVWYVAAVFFRRRGSVWHASVRESTQPVLIISLALLALGCLCLIRDLAFPEKVHLLFTHPTLSLLTIGAFTLAAFIVCLGYLVFAAFQKKKGRVAHVVRTAVQLIAALLALVTMVYTGVFLATITAVPFWNTPLVPVLFVLSSLSAGISILVPVAILRTATTQGVARVPDFLVTIDVFLIAAEAGTALLLYLLSSGDEIIRLSLAELLTGRLFYEFWIGFVLCALVLPLVMEVFTIIVQVTAPTYYVILGCLILIGGFFLRYCLINAGVHLSELLGSGLVAL